MNASLLENITRVIKHYGVPNQQKKLAEEVYELQEAITTYYNAKQSKHTCNFVKLKENVAEEIADVLFLLEQLRIECGVPITYIKDILNYKVSRQIERIKNEQ